MNLLLGTLRRLLGAGRGMSRLMLRQRRTVAGTAELTRLFDVHAVAVAADAALLVALLAMPGAPSRPSQWAALAAAVLLSMLAALIRFRSAVGIWCGLRGVAAVLAAQWIPGWALLLALAASAPAQWSLHLGLLARATRGQAGERSDQGPTGSPAQLPVLLRAVSYSLAAAVFASLGALLAALLNPSWPLWLTAMLLTLATLLALRIPRIPRASRSPGLPRRPTASGAAGSARPVVPAQKPAAPPEGYTVYRPNSLDSRE